MSAWSVKTRYAPSQHCRDARVYGHTATAMHDNDYTVMVIRRRSSPHHEKYLRRYLRCSSNVPPLREAFTRLAPELRFTSQGIGQLIQATRDPRQRLCRPRWRARLIPRLLVQLL